MFDSTVTVDNKKKPRVIAFFCSRFMTEENILTDYYLFIRSVDITFGV